MAPRRPPLVGNIVDVLRRSGNADTDALTKANAVRAVRLAFRTTRDTASAWIAEASSQDNPQLVLVSSSSHNSLDCVWRGKWVGLEELGLMRENPAPHDFIMLRPNGSQTLDSIPDNQGPTQWVILADTFRAMVTRTREHEAMKREEQQEKARANLAQFTNAHPRAVQTLQRLLDAAGARNRVTEIRATHTGHAGQVINGVPLGGPNHLSLTLYGDDIDAVTTLLTELLK